MTYTLKAVILIIPNQTFLSIKDTFNYKEENSNFTGETQWIL